MKRFFLLSVFLAGACAFAEPADSLSGSYLCRGAKDAVKVTLDEATLRLKVELADGATIEGYSMRRSLPAAKRVEFYFSRGDDAGYSSSLRFNASGADAVTFHHCMGCKPFVCGAAASETPPVVP